MGYFSNLEIEILEWQSQGRTVDETYIYFKDYVSREEVERIFTQDCDLDPREYAENAADEDAIHYGHA